MFNLTSGSSERNISSEKKASSFCQNCILNVGELFEEIFFNNNFFQLILDFEAKCLELPAKSFQQSYQNCFLRVQWTTLRMSIIFSEIFESFWILSDNCPNLWLKFSAAFPNVPSTCPKYFFGFFVNGSHVFFNFGLRQRKIFLKKKFRHFCWNCILSVPRTFWGVFIKNVLVFQFSLVFQAKFIKLPAEIFQQSSKMHFEPKRFELRRKFSTESSKRHFTCPEEHFYKNNILTLWNNYRLWAMKCRICGGEFAALLSNLHFCLRMGNWKNSFERIFIFLIFFGCPGNIFWFFCCIIPGMVVQTEFHHPRGTYPLRIILRENFRPFRTMSAVFWTFIEVF